MNATSPQCASDRILLVDNRVVRNRAQTFPRDVAHGPAHGLVDSARYLETRGFVIDLEYELAPACRRVDAARSGLVYDLVATDVDLASPGDGLRLAEFCASLNPRIPVILLAERPSLDAALEGMRRKASDFLTKPFSIAELERRARQTIEERRLRQRIAQLEQVNALLSLVLPNAIEAKDPTTRGHSDRVACYAMKLGERCGIEGDELNDLRLAALLHDIGKIGVPEAILTKEGPLTRDERAEIEKHPGIGYRILQPLDRLPRVCDWVLQHHEHWDGRGYPHGLARDEVALPGRILILAEVFDALATQRSYKPAWSTTKIADFFEADRGRHFDPELARLVAEGIRREGSAWFSDQSGCENALARHG
ncbi:MAG: HD domain-containing protein [Planctomycetes bacterium]|nr:HD domain-containing protein [Planctomycetota bacterium]